MKSHAICLLLLISIVTSCANKEENKSEIIIENIEYYPEMVAPGVISTSFFEGHASVTPDNNEMFYAIYTNDHSYSTIVFSKKNNGAWQEPQVAPFSGVYNDGSPALSPDGTKLFFSSNRPINGSEVNSSNDIWMVERNGTDWSEPVHLKAVNSKFFDFSPSVDRQGHLYFCSKRPGGFGDMDVYVSYYTNGSYQTPKLLSENINTEFHEGNVGVSPDGKQLFVMVQHKPGDYGYDDIHYSFKQDSTWAPLKNIGKKVNTYTYDFSPKVSPDGKTLFFSSRVNRNFVNKNGRYDYNTFSNYLNSPLNGFGNIYKIALKDLDLN